MPARSTSTAARVLIEAPRLMTDAQLAGVLEEFVRELQARPRKESVHVSQPEPPLSSNLPFKRKPPKRWR
jgi:hypothetical protein